MVTKRVLLSAMVAIGPSLSGMGVAAAQSATAPDWPTRPVTMVVPVAARGQVDFVGRILAARLSKSLGQPVIVENISGADGMTAAARVAKAAPDGHQCLLGTSGTHAHNQSLYKRPFYNAATDFAPVALVAQGPLLLIARPDLTSVDEEGLTDFEADGWTAVFMPKGTPATIVRKLHEATVAAMNTPSVQERLKAIGITVVAPERRSPEYLAAFVRSEIEKWAAVIKAAGVSAD